MERGKKTGHFERDKRDVLKETGTVMKCLWKSLYLCGVQAYLFSAWQRFGNISGITY